MTARRVTSALAALCAAGWLLLAAAPAQAHARLLSSSPADGATVAARLAAVTLTFDDTIRLLPQALVVTGGTGAPLATGPARVVAHRTLRVALLDQLAPGRYLVGWRILSDDGHVVSGSFGFAVAGPGAAGAAPSGASAPAPGATGAPAQPVWPVVVAAVLAGVALAGAGIVVRRGLRAVEVARADTYPDTAPGPGTAPVRHATWPDGDNQSRH